MNMPNDATVEDDREGLRSGVAARAEGGGALYRDGCKASQPLSTSSSDSKETAKDALDAKAVAKDATDAKNAAAAHRDAVAGAADSRRSPTHAAPQEIAVQLTLAE